MTIQEIVSIEEIATDVQSGFASGERTADGVVQLRMNNVTTEGSLNWSSYIRVPTSKKQIEKYQLQPGDILFNNTNSPELVGKTAVFKDFGEPVVFSNHFVRLRVDEERVDPQYLAAWFIKQWQNRVFESLCTQWVNQAAVRKEDLLDLKIPLPPLTEQKRIASLLARADRLRTLRRTAHELGESLLQSVFLEMFGDVVRNDKGWEKVSISDLGKVQTGNTPSREEPENYGDFIEWIKSDNIRDEQLYVSPSREKLSKIGLKKGRSVDAGAVLVTCIAGSLEHIGDTSLTNRTVAFNQQINAISPFDGVNPLFLRTMMRIAKPHIQFNASAGMKHIITKSKLEELVLVKPPLSLQEEFAGVVARVESLRGRMSEAGRQVEGLFESLLAESFG